MRILDKNSDKSLKNVILYLTKDEMIELRDDLEDLICSNEMSNHAHINDLEYSHEVTVTMYDMNNFNHFDERSKLLIQSDI